MSLKSKLYDIIILQEKWVNQLRMIISLFQHKIHSPKIFPHCLVFPNVLSGSVFFQNTLGSMSQLSFYKVNATYIFYLWKFLFSYIV